jgi:sialate O-acetylesterase
VTFLYCKKVLIATLLICIGLFCFAQKKRITVACIGNSVTYGSTLKDPELTSYPSQLQARLGNNYEVKNFGVPGSTLLRSGHRPYYLSTAFIEALALKPDVAIIDLGLNDTDPRDWPPFGDVFESDYAWLIDTIRSANPAVRIFICSLSPIFHDHPRFKSGTREWFWKIQERIAHISKANHTGLVDFHTALYQRPDLLPDNLHPNEEGASILAEQVYQQLTGKFGGLQLASVFASHMVVQRSKPILFYGTANAYAKVVVTFAAIKQIVNADGNGQWKIRFPAMSTGGPLTAFISSEDKVIRIDDILIGEVWICSGQSNMAFPLHSAINAKDEMIKAELNSNVRFLNMKVLTETDNTAWDTVILNKVNRLQYFSGTWQRCDSTSAKSFSAVAYYFAKQLQQQLHVPVGLIQVAVGGSTAESWIDRYTMEADPELVNELSGWRKSDFFQPWTRERADINLKVSIDPKQRHPYEPCYNYEAGIAQFVGFPIRGAIWYQGESNAHNLELHERIFPRLVASWRKQWGYEFPFYYVQLSSLNRPSWTLFRNSQLQMLKIIPNSGMAVSSDIGDSTNVHPPHKREVGERLARLALYHTYQQKSIIPSGPLPLKAQRLNNEIVVSFQFPGMQLKTSDGNALRGFLLRNEKGQDKIVKAIIQQNKVIITLNKNERPVKLMYAWKPFSDANLVNSAGLPASTFQIQIE